jgi:hypothetical protein
VVGDHRFCNIWCSPCAANTCVITFPSAMACWQAARGRYKSNMSWSTGPADDKWGLVDTTPCLPTV